MKFFVFFFLFTLLVELARIITSDNHVWNQTRQSDCRCNLNCTYSFLKTPEARLRYSTATTVTHPSRWKAKSQLLTARSTITILVDYWTRSPRQILHYNVCIDDNVRVFPFTHSHLHQAFVESALDAVYFVRMRTTQFSVLPSRKLRVTILGPGRRADVNSDADVRASRGVNARPAALQLNQSIVVPGVWVHLPGPTACSADYRCSCPGRPWRSIVLVLPSSRMYPPASSVRGSLCQRGSQVAGSARPVAGQTLLPVQVACASQAIPCSSWFFTATAASLAVRPLSTNRSHQCQTCSPIPK
ncbi:unnamed protein product [Nesidiocoris tenuis]|uniref:Uncharacterized protein n=1 Tax=Nesidiocoris tenuis TaxID=355587 RepID=A0A6H5GAZ5_9HEMI|nr:unnamed protein product [Nesidiocoris tenuis]